VRAGSGELMVLHLQLYKLLLYQADVGAEPQLEVVS
jgi:hypothetical protein